MIKKFLSLVAILILFSGCSQNPDTVIDTVTKKSSEAVIEIIDVGQGSSAIIKSEDQVVLIDSGEKEYASSVLDALKRLDVDEIDVAIATHPHSDHIGAFPEIMKEYPIKTLYMPNITHTSYTYDNLLDAAEKSGVKIKVPEMRDMIDVGEGRIEILSNNNDYGDNLNAYSIVSKITFSGVSYFTGGDLDGKGLKDLMNSGVDLSSSIFQAFHHGSANDTNTQELMDNMNPEVVIISVGASNDYGHPHQEVLDYLNRTGKTVYRTDINGNITINIDKAGHYSVTTNKVNEQMPNEDIPEIVSVIGNKNSKIYHKESCTNLPVEKNRVYFAQEQEAIDAGYKPSKECVK